MAFRTLANGQKVHSRRVIPALKSEYRLPFVPPHARDSGSSIRLVKYPGEGRGGHAEDGWTRWEFIGTFELWPNLEWSGRRKHSDTAGKNRKGLIGDRPVAVDQYRAMALGLR